MLEWDSEAQRLYDNIQAGNSMWLVIASNPPGKWYLRSRIVLKAKRHLSIPSEWGQFECIGDSETTQTYDIKNQMDFMPFLISMEFKTGKSIKLTGSEIGLAIEGPRQLSVSDCIRLNKYIGGLKRI